MKDGEIQRLQANLQERQANDQSDLIENLRIDLQNMIEKNQRSKIFFFLSVGFFQLKFVHSCILVLYTLTNAI